MKKRKREVFDDTQYFASCKEELVQLKWIGLFQILEDLNAPKIKRDFRKKFEFVSKNSEFSQAFPIYHFMLKIRLRSGLTDFDKKNVIIGEASLKIANLFKQYHLLPEIGEEILWNLTLAELVKFNDSFH